MARNPHTLHQNTYEKYCKHMMAMRAAGLNPRGTHFWRSEEEQARYFAEKKSKVLFGWHNITTATGYPNSYAYDITLLTDDDREVLPDSHPHWQKAAEIGEECGMYSGGIHWGWDFGHFQDSYGKTLDEARLGKEPPYDGKGLEEAKGDHS